MAGETCTCSEERASSMTTRESELLLFVDEQIVEVVSDDPDYIRS